MGGCSESVSPSLTRSSANRNTLDERELMSLASIHGSAIIERTCNMRAMVRGVDGSAITYSKEGVPKAGTGVLD